MGNSFRFLKLFELFKGRYDTLWRIVTERRGPTPIPSVLSKILDKMLRPKG